MQTSPIVSAKETSNTSKRDAIRAKETQHTRKRALSYSQKRHPKTCHSSCLFVQDSWAETHEGVDLVGLNVALVMLV